MNEKILESIKELRKRLAEIIEEIKADSRMVEMFKIHQAINSLEDCIGEPKTSLAQAFGLSQNSEGAIVSPDEFYGLTPLEAAKKYLKKMGRALHIDEIRDGIERGGCQVESAIEFRISLARSTMEIAKVGNDYFGLVEFYPHIKRRRRRRITSNETNNQENNGRLNSEKTQSEEESQTETTKEEE
ncbi:MAG: hypothetical protein ACE5KZ_13210 [Candidatus Scalinduaceae bacterium]